MKVRTKTDLLGCTLLVAMLWLLHVVTVGANRGM